ncbi:hypothetical protein DXX99_03565 [Ammonifex thiophilus]|uniref:Uncharacterized protein n=2 Tax=Ammonifex thiophilus TaxID=444093 RepID=A0A3D8P475_9THEO|nr:hypothetical protein DXX99_03565 [Ammonifex thiophilus]
MLVKERKKYAYAGNLRSRKHCRIPYPIVPAQEALFVDPRQVRSVGWAAEDSVCGYLLSFPPACEIGCCFASAVFPTRKEAVLYAFRRWRQRLRYLKEHRLRGHGGPPFYYEAWPEEGCVFGFTGDGGVAILPCWVPLERELRRARYYGAELSSEVLAVIDESEEESWKSYKEGRDSSHLLLLFFEMLKQKHLESGDQAAFRRLITALRKSR